MKRYSFVSADYVKIPHIYVIGYASDKEVTRYGPSARNEYIIHYVLSGKGYFNGCEVNAGEGFLITPQLREHYYPDEENPWSYLWIISSDSAMEYFFERHRADKNGIFKFKNEHKLFEIVKNLKSTQSKNGSLNVSSTKISELFLDIFHTCIGGESVYRESMSKIYYESAVNYIHGNLHLGITVGTLCASIGVSQQYLFKIFKSHAGMSAQKYILNAKLNRAKKLLLETSLSVSQVAVSVGFAIVSDFSSFFIRQTGVSPTAYRNKQ